ncbi:MAG: serine/threonine protein kinase, partial [Actinomycetota bacterium]
MSACTQPACQGSIVDGYCDVCGMAESSAAAATTGAAPSSGPTASVRSSTVTNRLGLVPLGSARSTAGSRPTSRLGARRARSLLGAGLTDIPS